MQKICKKYAKICNKICRNMQKYANKICKNMQNICKNIRVYVFAYGAYICTPHFADAARLGSPVPWRTRIKHWLQ